MNKGWIKLYRSISGSSTFQKLTAVQKLIAIYILLNANHKDSVWIDHYRGIEVNVKRGQLITSRQKIIEEWFNNDKNVTNQKIRTCLTKLEKLGFLTIESTNWYTLITVVNYGIYQGGMKKITNTQPAHNQQDNHKQEVFKNDQEGNKKNPSFRNRSKTYSEDSDYFKMAQYFYEKVKAVAEEEGLGRLIIKSDLQKWADEFRKIVEIDKVEDKHLIRDVLDWVTSDTFWKVNVLSAKKLRAKFGELALKMKAAQRPKQHKKVDYRDKEIAFQEWVSKGNDENDFDWS
ncbi:hypothetical protein [Brevibacillus reuszeri]|uniref:hypothetical protein n=1 Tax=Brevibacillus reuszeri TaxID=54915 RepID=UPI001F45B095|nr:hypothetical protein [Brevibacillus reuszeri]